MNRKLLLIPATILGFLAFAGTSLAHNGAPVPSCTGVSISLTNYEKGNGANNKLSVHIVNSDGSSSFQTATFASFYSNTFAWSQFQSHDWTITVDANLTVGNPTQYDQTWSGHWNACQTPPTTTVAPTTTIPATTAPTTTLPCQEDEPCWDCTTMGNQICGPTTTINVDQCCVVVPSTSIALDVVALTPDDPQLPRTGLNSDTIGYIAAVAVLSGFGLLATAGVRRRHQ